MKGTLIGFAILMVIVILLVRLIWKMVKTLINKTRGELLGKNPIEYDRASKLLLGYYKNGVIPKWAVYDALAVLKGCYTQEAAMDIIKTTLESNKIECVDFPKSLYMKPGTEKEKLIEICKEKMKRYNMKKILSENGKMTDEDFKTQMDLVYMWYFADDSVSTQQEAMGRVAGVLADYTEEYSKRSK